MTEEQKTARNANLARAREAAKAKREQGAEVAAAMPEPEDEPVEEIGEDYAPPTIAEGGVAVTEPDEPEAPIELTPFERWVSTLDSETRALLDDADLAEIWEAQEAKAKAERKASAKKLAAAHALQTARIAEGVIAPATADELAWRERMEEPVEFMIEMPHVGEGVADIGMRIDQRIYLDGVRYTLPRKMYDSMRYNLFIARQNELLFEGRDRRHWLRRQATGTVEGRIN